MPQGPKHGNSNFNYLWYHQYQTKKQLYELYALETYLKNYIGGVGWFVIENPMIYFTMI